MNGDNKKEQILGSYCYGIRKNGTNAMERIQ